MTDPLTSNPLIENWRTYCDSTPGFGPAAARNMFRDLSAEIERLTARVAEMEDSVLIAGRVRDGAMAERERLRAQIRQGHCTECGCALQTCALMWRDQRKCCPDCQHAGAALRASEDHF